MGDSNKDKKFIPEAEYKQKYLSLEMRRYLYDLPCYKPNKIREPGETGVLHCIGRHRCNKCSSGLEKNLSLFLLNKS